MNVLAIDFDGTICDENNVPIEGTIESVNKAFENKDNFIVIYTARSYSMFKETRQWLHNFEVKHHALVMEKMRATKYFDDKAAKI